MTRTETAQRVMDDTSGAVATGSLPAVAGEQRSVLRAMAHRYDMEPKSFEATLRATVVPEKCSREQFAAFLVVAKEYGLNPLTKEIYAFASKGGGIQPIVGIDGWANLINSHPAFDGMEFRDEVDSSGNVVSITCEMFRKDRRRSISATEYLAECRRPTDPWNKWPRRMLRHKAMIQAARYAFGFAGIVDPDEYDRFSGDVARDITPPRRRLENVTQTFNEFAGGTTDDLNDDIDDDIIDNASFDGDLDESTTGDFDDSLDDSIDNASMDDEPVQEQTETGRRNATGATRASRSSSKRDNRREHEAEQQRRSEPERGEADDGPDIGRDHPGVDHDANRIAPGQAPTNEDEYEYLVEQMIIDATDAAKLKSDFVDQGDLRRKCNVSPKAYEVIKAKVLARIAELRKGTK